MGGTWFNGEKIILRRVDKMGRIQFPSILTKSTGIKTSDRFEIFVRDFNVILKPFAENGHEGQSNCLSVIRHIDSKRRLKIPIEFYRELLAREGSVFEVRFDKEKNELQMKRFSEMKEVFVVSKHVIAGLSTVIGTPVIVTDHEMIVGGFDTKDKDRFYGKKLSIELMCYILDDNLQIDEPDSPGLHISDEFEFDMDLIFPIYGLYSLIGSIIVLKEKGSDGIKDPEKYFLAVKTAAQIIEFEMRERGSKNENR